MSGKPRQMQVVKDVVADRERRQAQRFAASRTKVAQSEARLKELEGYHDSYKAGLSERMAQGISITNLRDYQAFLQKLAEAVRQQNEIVMKARAESDTQRRQWQGAAQRVKIIDKVIENRGKQQQRIEDARDQRETDERALRSARRQD